VHSLFFEEIFMGRIACEPIAGINNPRPPVERNSYAAVEQPMTPSNKPRIDLVKNRVVRDTDYVSGSWFPAEHKAPLLFSIPTPWASQTDFA